jgi:hypothetical protein
MELDLHGAIAPPRDHLLKERLMLLVWHGRGCFGFGLLPKLNMPSAGGGAFPKRLRGGSGAEAVCPESRVATSDHILKRKSRWRQPVTKFRLNRI